MKAEELMITTSDVMVGDWVRITIEGEQYPAVVNSIKLNTEEIGVSFLAAPGDWEDDDGYDEIEPIPLTEEILKVNGFGLLGDAFWWYKDFHITLSSSKALTLVCGRTIQFKYAHELQHALRLCGIEKEIVIKKEWL